jgi:hypothetical protein
MLSVVESGPAADEPSICVGCGLCCDGTLFSHLGVTDESDLGLPLRSLGVEIVAEADPPVFALPCPALHRGVCTVYHLQRPRACGWFECDVSTAVAEGALARDEARAIIADTLALRDRVQAGTADATALRAAVATHFRRDDD